MMATVVTVQDRIYAINQTISEVTAERYFPESQDSARLPLLTCLPGRKVYKKGRGAQSSLGTREHRLLLIVEAWMAGIPTQSAQEAAEILIDAIEDAYLCRPRLELNGGDPLDGVTDVTLGGDSGLIPFGELWVAVEWPLSITTRKTFDYAGT